ncbi:MAG: hypothetical protein V1649_03695 [Patescibacteria group bacterium]
MAPLFFREFAAKEKIEIVKDRDEATQIFFGGAGRRRRRRRNAFELFSE